MIPSAAMLKNLEQRSPSNFRMENLLQTKATADNDFSLTLNNWAASLMARQWEQKASAAAAAAATAAANNIELYKRSRRDVDITRDLDEHSRSMQVDIDLQTVTELETDGELITYGDRLIQIRVAKRVKADAGADELQDDERKSTDFDNERDWMSLDDMQGSSIGKNDEQIAGNEETCSTSCNDDHCVKESSSPVGTAGICAQDGPGNEKPELKFGVKAILADNYDRRRSTETFQTLQHASRLPTVNAPSYSHNLQSSPSIPGSFPVGIAKPIARPTAYHPHHHPAHPSHSSGSTQHHFQTHAHHTLQLLACRGPYITVSTPGAGGHLTATTTVTPAFPGGIQHGIGDLASMSGVCFPWAGSTRGRPRKGMMKRAVFSDTQRRGLEKRFLNQKYISKPDRKKLAEKLGLKDSQVKIWFQNRRMKWRNNKERELMANGGSREQTLPNKNNPNPDLSDTDIDRSKHDRNGDQNSQASPGHQDETSDNEETEEINVT